MSIRETTAYQVACDECGGTADDLGAEYSTWLNADDANVQGATSRRAPGPPSGHRSTASRPSCRRPALATASRVAQTSAVPPATSPCPQRFRWSGGVSMRRRLRGMRWR